jgi:mannose-6-phosphate isomerase-like protein (cupin superfamily)
VEQKKWIKKNSQKQGLKEKHTALHYLKPDQMDSQKHKDDDQIIWTGQARLELVLKLKILHSHHKMFSDFFHFLAGHGKTDIAHHLVGFQTVRDKLLVA